MAVSRENLTAWLRDAHAMESQAIEILEKQASWIKNYPERERRCAIIWRNPSAQAERLEQCLERLGTDTSAIKTGLGKAIGPHSSSPVCSPVTRWSRAGSPTTPSSTTRSPAIAP